MIYFCVALTSTFLFGTLPIEMSSTDAGTIVGGPTSGIDWGRPLASGDLDGDGFDDFVVSASESFGGGVSEVYVIRGDRGAHGRGFVDLAATMPDLIIRDAQVDGNLGASIATGDINGDGVDDLLAVASLADFAGVNDRGIAYVLYGGPMFFANLTRDLSDDSQWDMRILGPVAAGDMGGALLFGGADTQAAAIGNLNGDAFGDIILGVHLADGDGNETGRVYVKFGGPFPSGFTFNLASGAAYDVQIRGAGELDELGTIVVAGDITGDDIDELIIPNEYASELFFSSEGAVYIFRGRASGWPSLVNLATTTADITLFGAREDDNLGASATVGDFNNDGIGDLATAAPGADVGAFNDQRGDGIVYGLLGDASLQTGIISIDYATIAPDFQFNGEFEENMGTIVTNGDYNGDGFADIAAAQRFAGPNINGTVEVLFGRDFAIGETFTANINNDLRIVGQSSDRIGFSLATINSNGDALDEILFGTPFNNGNRGTVYVATFVSGDADLDGDVDLCDYALLQPCIGTVFAAPPTLPCVQLDFSLDEVIDGADVDGFAERISGPAD